MRNVIRNLTIAIAGVVAATSLTGCATTAESIDTAGEMAAANEAANAVVFGKFRLVRNGEDVEFGDSIFANSAKLYLSEAGSTGEIVGAVGRDGEFAWALQPGEYQVSSIAFKFHGETIEPATNFSFTVSPEYQASYIGTITLETMFDHGYYGVSGTIDRFSVSNDCKSECATRLSRLGLDENSATTSLLHWNQHVASTN